MKCVIIRTWAVVQIAIGVAIVASTAYFAPSAFDKMREEAQRTGKNLKNVSAMLVAARVTYAESATNLFASTGEMEDVAAKLQDAGGKIGDVGHMFEKHGRKFERAERHNRESKILWDKVETPFAKYIADIYGNLKEWSLNASTNLCDVGRDLSGAAKAVGKQREAIAKYEREGHPKTLLAMESSAETIGHVGELLVEGESIDILARSVYVLCGIIALLFIGNGIVLLVVVACGPSTPRPTPQGA